MTHHLEPVPGIPGRPDDDESRGGPFDDPVERVSGPDEGYLIAHGDDERVDERVDERLELRRPRWWRWVALALIVAMLATMPFVWILLRGGRREAHTFQIPVGRPISIAASVARPGDRIECPEGEVSVLVPEAGGVARATGSGTTFVSIVVRTAPDGAVTAFCGVGL